HAVTGRAVAGPEAPPVRDVREDPRPDVAADRADHRREDGTRRRVDLLRRRAPRDPLLQVGEPGGHGVVPTGAPGAVRADDVLDEALDLGVLRRARDRAA